MHSEFLKAILRWLALRVLHIRGASLLAAATILHECEDVLLGLNLSKKAILTSQTRCSAVIPVSGLFVMVSVLGGGFQFAIGCLHMLFRGCGVSAQFIFVGTLGFVGLGPSLYQMLLGFRKIGMAMPINIFNRSLGTEHSSTK